MPAFRTTLTAAAMAAACLPANAQDTDSAPGDGELAAIAPVEIGDAEAEAFARTYQRVAAIRDAYERRMRGLEPPERGALRDRANAEMLAAVERSGLEVGRYNELVVAMAADPAFKRRVLAALEDTGAAQEQ